MVPTGHLHSPRFLDIWKGRGIEVMRLIVEEEFVQLGEIQTEIDISAQLLEPFTQDQESEKRNESLKKEVERTQKNLRINKQEKFKQNIADWEKDDVFDPTLQRGRSQLRRSRKNSSSIKCNSSTDSEEESTMKTDFFRERSGRERQPRYGTGPISNHSERQTQNAKRTSQTKKETKEKIRGK